MWKTLDRWDTSLFLSLNNVGCPALDPVMMAVTDYAFLPLGALVLFLLFKTLGWKRMLLALGFIALTILFTDQTCGNLIRDLNVRLRPCHMEALAGQFRSVREWETGSCGGMYGFVSSHSGNAFALAVFASLAIKKRIKHAGWFRLALFALATLIAYSRIYIGTHFPGDAIVAAVVGGVYADFFYLLYKKTAERTLGSDLPGGNTL